jgi:DNA invertase Pin-like site-specific DNA recombinase
MLFFSQQTRKKAIAYYRHSAEDKQENSVAIQRQHTHKFADEHNIEIIHEEADEGKSGLLANRPAFERLFANWIENSNAPHFDYVFAYDVSRWGRFQDQDQAAHLTYQCRKHGKEVVYVSRGFTDVTNQLSASLEISLQRYMAAEYSRQLSDKVYYGCVKVSEQGYSAGGTAVYGMARLLLDVNKKPIRILKTGEHKQIANERVSFTPKNDETTETVREIFNLFVKERYLITDIVARLNQNDVLSANGKRWDRSKVIKTLTDETYIGTRIYNKTWGRLKQKSHKNPRSEWVITPSAFESVVDEKLFKDAQERLYWLFPSNWRKGFYAIKKAKKNIRNEIFQWLLNKGFTEFEAEKTVSELPIIFAVKNKNKHLSHWCFRILEDTRRFDNVLAISVVLDTKTMIDDFFLFSVHDFTQTNYLILSQYNPLYCSSKIENSGVEEIIIQLIGQLKTQKMYCH